LLNERIKILTENLLSAEKKISLLQILNTNLINGEKAEMAKLKIEIKKLDISVMLTPHFGDIDPPHRKWFKEQTA
jgi:hypothetical protein